MRVLHITTVRVLYGGQRAQLGFEAIAAKALQLEWDTIALHTEDPASDFERQIPRYFRHRLLIRLYGWIFAIRKKGSYDIILFRDMQLDVFGPLLGWFVRNRVTVHHAKEMEELAVLEGRNRRFNRVAVAIEKHLKPATMKSALGAAGVTEEIRKYEVARFPWLSHRSLVYPNGYDFSKTTACDDRRSPGRISIAFVCTEFSEWHGLDRLVAALVTKRPRGPESLTLHLVGKLTDDQRDDISRLADGPVTTIEHGTLTAAEIDGVLGQCDVAIGSLALDRKGLSEASTLKVREYLAAGVPVYSTHKDASLPHSFPFYMNDQEGISIERIVAFAASTSAHSRADVRTAAQAHLDKRNIIAATYSTLEHLSKFRQG